MDHMHDHESNGDTGGRWKWALIGFLAVAGFFLWTEHRAHLFGALPYLLILACPLMHLFHHGGHGGHAGQGGHQHAEPPPAKPTGRPDTGAQS